MLLASAVVALAVNTMMVRAEKDRTDAAATPGRRQLSQCRPRAAPRRIALGQSDHGPGLSLCEHGEVNRGLLWLAHALEVTPPRNENLASALRASLAAWSRRLTSLKVILRHPAARVAAALFPPIVGRSSR